MKKRFLLFCAIYLTFISHSIGQVLQQQQVVFPSQPVHKIDGVTWSSAIGNNLVTGSTFWVYINTNLEAVVAKKSSTGAITTKVLMQNVPNNENHAEFSLGVDNEGYIHVIGGIHNAAPKYYVSTNPDDISSFEFRGNDPSIGGLEGKEITYQSFVRSNKGTLFVTYRTNLVGGFVTGARGIALARYDTKTKRWTMIGGKNYQIMPVTATPTAGCIPLTGDQIGLTAFVWNNSGVGDMRPIPGKCFSHAHYQGYQLRIKFGNNNRMHVSYNMADSIVFKGDESQFMTHVFYAYSDDEGNTWHKANGSQITTFPITKARGGLVHKRLPAGYNYPDTAYTPTMSNSTGLILDRDGLPIVIQQDHIANRLLMFKWNGTSWVDQNYTTRGEKFYTDLTNKRIYNFGAASQFQMSTDNMATFTNLATMDYPPFWYVIVDNFYLTKKRNVMYYAYSDKTAPPTATIVNMVVAPADATAPAAPSGLNAPPSEIIQDRITLNWTASSELDVARYDVYRNGTFIGSTGSTYYIFTGLSSATNYTFTVKAVDGSGNSSALSSGLTVKSATIDPLPTVSLTAPSANTSFIEGTTYTLQASASDSNGTIAKVGFYRDGVLLGEDTTSPYSLAWTPVAGTYTVTAKATDNAGGVTTSAARTVTVNSAVILNESMWSGTTPTANGSISLHESNNRFVHDELTMSGTGTTSNSEASTYSGASGTWNINLSYSGAQYFDIAGINTSGRTGLQLSFGVRKSTTTSTGSTLAVQVSSDGTTWNNLTIPALPTGTSGWSFVTASGTIPATSNLRIRFKNLGSSTVIFRIDDVKLRSGVSGIASVNNVEMLSLESQESSAAKVYPNPTTGIVNIHWNGKSAANYAVLALDGRKVKHGKLSGNASQTVDLSEVAKGVYVLKIGDSTESSTHKIVVE